MDVNQTKITIEYLLDRVSRIPALPQVVQKALQIIEDPKSSMGELAKVIKLDQVMTVLILRWVNSGYYALNYKVTSIEQAIALLGQRSVQNLVLSASVSQFMSQPVPGYELDRGALWKRSIGMAAGARLLAQPFGTEMAEQAYYAGLLSDIGKLAYNYLIKNVQIDWDVIASLPFDHVEEQLFGYDHADVGAEIAKRWNLADHLVEIIRNHHTPSLVSEQWRNVAYAVHGADAILMTFGIGIGLDSMQYKLDPHVMELFNLDTQRLDDIFERISPMIEEANSYLRI